MFCLLTSQTQNNPPITFPVPSIFPALTYSDCLTYMCPINFSYHTHDSVSKGVKYSV